MPVGINCLKILRDDQRPDDRLSWRKSIATGRFEQPPLAMLRTEASDPIGYPPGLSAGRAEALLLPHRETESGVTKPVFDFIVKGGIRQEFLHRFGFFAATQAADW